MEATWSTLAYCLTQQDTLNIIGDPANGNRFTYTSDDLLNNTDPRERISSGLSPPWAVLWHAIASSSGLGLALTPATPVSTPVAGAFVAVAGATAGLFGGISYFTG